MLNLNVLEWFNINVGLFNIESIMIPFLRPQVQNMPSP